MILFEKFMFAKTNTTALSIYTCSLDKYMYHVTSVQGYGDSIVSDLKRIAPNETLDGPLFLKHAKHLPEPRLLKANIPLSLLHPNLLDTCKVCKPFLLWILIRYM